MSTDITHTNSQEITFFDYVKDYFYNTNAIEITSNVYIGNVKCSRNKVYLKFIGITNIIKIGKKLKEYYPNDFDYLGISIEDSRQENIFSFFHYTCDYIENVIANNGKVFVHCVGGISRSVSIICAYLIRSKRMSYEESFDLVKSKRNIAYPNSSFINQLREFHIKVNTSHIKIKKENDKINYSSTCRYKKKDFKIIIEKSKGIVKEKRHKIMRKSLNKKVTSKENNILRIHQVLTEVINSYKKKYKDINKFQENVEIFLKKHQLIVDKVFNLKSYKESNNQTKLLNTKYKNLVKRIITKFKKDIFFIKELD